MSEPTIEQVTRERDDLQSRLYHWCHARHNFTEADESLSIWQMLDRVYEDRIAERDDLRAALRMAERYYLPTPVMIAVRNAIARATGKEVA